MTIRKSTLDCEFVANDFRPEGLISMGMTDGANHVYLVNPEFDIEMPYATEEQRAWLKANVFRHLPLTADGQIDPWGPNVAHSYTDMRTHVANFFDLGGHRRNQLVHMHCGAQDMVRTHTLWANDWSRLPESVPTHFEDMKNVFRRGNVNETLLPKMDPAREHHALWDAEHDFETLVHLAEVVRP